LLQDSGLKERFDAYHAIIAWLEKGVLIRDHALSPFAMEIALGVCRHHLRLKHAIQKGVKRMPAEKVQALLEMGLYQLFFMDGVPDHASLSTTVELARAASLGEGAVRLVSAVLRNAQRSGLPPLPTQNVLRISIGNSVPEWIVRRWLDEYGAAEAEERAKETSEKPTQWIRVNTSRTSFSRLRDKFGLQGRDYADRYLEVSSGTGKSSRLGNLLASDAFAQGLFSVQNPAAYDVVRLLEGASGQEIWDACAAPGGKSALLAEMFPDASILASDISSERMRFMEDLTGRLGLKNVKSAVVDALHSGFENKFDRILLDVPCSNMGVLSRRPEVLYRLKPEDFKTLPVLQGEILDAASKALKPGGILVYATCSPERVETTRVIELFLKDNSEFEKHGEPVRIGKNDMGLDHFFAQALMRKS
jgi:16S rRNA (cytosine967-C5)-methyltransferase